MIYEDKELYNNKFSIAHTDATKDDNRFYNSFVNSSQQYKNEIYDIFFGGKFVHTDVTYGDVMGVQPSDVQYKNLLKIQEKYGTGISLTLNEMNRPLEMVRSDIIKDFIIYLKKFYDDGVRSCTISHTHLMRTGALQEAFPDMEWKNTVNHGIRSTQEFVDYAKLGYTTVQLDRSFNRNISELKRVKKEADRLGVKTCLLIMESCMPECPFKTEHDCWQPNMQTGYGQSYWEAIPFTCNKWYYDKYTIFGLINPRKGTDVICHSKDDWKDFASLVDIFKKSGRLMNFPKQTVEKFGYFFETPIPENVEQRKFPPTKLFVVDSFKDVYENNLAPLHMWHLVSVREKDYPAITDIGEIQKELANHFWNEPDSKLLAKVLKNCKNQCYKCHKCDDVFKTGRLDSMLDVEQNIPIMLGKL
tara:strand:- start:97 stop:1344 length:1248 start_codon:yes stop_codon:yes gene_type:complete